MPREGSKNDNKARVEEVVKQNDGATPTEIAAETGLSRGQVSAALNQMEGDKVERSGTTRTGATVWKPKH